MLAWETSWGTWGHEWADNNSEEALKIDFQETENLSLGCSVSRSISTMLLHGKKAHN